MIALTKAHIYREFDGDNDGWSRLGNLSDRQQMSEADWSDLDQILRKLSIVQSGQASPEFESRTFAELRALCENNEVCDYVQQLAKPLSAWPPRGSARG